jgi:hypothetical protein
LYLTGWALSFSREYGIGNITGFAIRSDGGLEIASEVKASCPANISISWFLTVKKEST